MPISDYFLKSTPFISSNDISIADLSAANELSQLRVLGFDAANGIHRCLLIKYMKYILRSCFEVYKMYSNIVLTRSLQYYYDYFL